MEPYRKPNYLAEIKQLQEALRKTETELEYIKQNSWWFRFNHHKLWDDICSWLFILGGFALYIMVLPVLYQIQETRLLETRNLAMIVAVDRYRSSNVFCYDRPPLISYVITCRVNDRYNKLIVELSCSSAGCR
jgi:hypothetical protein